MEFFRLENLWLYLPLILWISGIFYLSSNKGSVSNTSRYLSPFFQQVFPETALASLKDYHLYFRKICHFLGYAILALLSWLAFSGSSVGFLAGYWPVLSFLVVLLTAAADEIKQSFYASRIGSVADVVLDCAGGLTMITLLWSISKLFAK
jgi:VanZ family protein